MSNAKNATKRRPWPEKRRKEQAERCRKTKPSQHATGPKTDAGKEKISGNARKNNLYSQEIRQLEKLLTQHKNYLKTIRLREMHKYSSFTYDRSSS